MGLVLPLTDRQLVDACDAELANAPQSDASAVEGARLRLAWALAHSERDADNERAVALLTELLQDSEQRGRREPLYLLAVAQWNLGHTLAARDGANEALRVAPACKQSLALRDACETRLAEDVLWVAAAGGLVVAGLAVAVGAFSKKR